MEVCLTQAMAELVSVEQPSSRWQRTHVIVGSPWSVTPRELANSMKSGLGRHQLADVKFLALIKLLITQAVPMTAFVLSLVFCR